MIFLMVQQHRIPYDRQSAHTDRHELVAQFRPGDEEISDGIEGVVAQETSGGLAGYLRTQGVVELREEDCEEREAGTILAVGGGRSCRGRGGSGGSRGGGGCMLVAGRGLLLLRV